MLRVINVRLTRSALCCKTKPKRSYMSTSVLRLSQPAENKAANVADNTKLQHSVLEEIMFKTEEAPKTTAQKVKKKAENTFFYAALAASVATLGGISYLLFDYFWSPSSPQRIYSQALEQIRADSECRAKLGDTITGFGEQSRRSRRHIASYAYQKENENRVRVTFHVKGDRGAGRAQVEVAQKPGEGWNTRYLFVEMSDHVNHVVLVDNR